jgi:basic amino acid/polyamine antiporter, APA family
LAQSQLARETPPAEPPRLVRTLSTWDGVLLTVGSVVGSGIFLTTSDMARVLPHPAFVLFVWLAGGLLTLAGALTYAELGAAFPRAGGIYHFLREAYGPLWGFLYGWACFLVIMSGGIAALAVGFAEYLSAFLPFFSTRNALLTVPLPWGAWTLAGSHVAAVGAIVFLTAINVLGVREGAFVQNLLTLLKGGAIAAFILLGFFGPAPTATGYGATLPTAGLLTAFGIAMIAALWTYDGWYALTFSAGEMKDPSRGLPRAIVLGNLAVMVVYVLLNAVYFRALDVAAVAASSRVAQDAATVLFGGWGARAVTAAVVISIFGCLSSTILYSSRTYQPMAEDGVFFPSLAQISAKYRTPVRSLWAQSAWAVVLTLSGSYNSLYTYVVFVAVVFHVATGAAVFVLRRRQPDLPRPYRTWGYPTVPALFIAASLLLVGNTLFEKPTESLLGVLLVALGLPAYVYWQRRARG